MLYVCCASSPTSNPTNTHNTTHNTTNRRQQKQNQDELLARINEETRRKLVEGGAASARTHAGGRKVSDIVTYRSPTDIPPVPSLQVLVCERVSLWGVCVCMFI